MEFPKNCWYPLTWSSGVEARPQKHRLCGEDVVLYRGSAGQIVALADMCPHRLAPLSFGKVKGDLIECGYHGMTFDETGRCRRIPGQPLIPERASVRAFPAAERMGLVWLFMGDPALADPSTIYDLPQHDDPAWSVAYGDALRIEAPYLDLADNLCDPSHVSFVHLSTLGSAAGEEIPVEWTTTADGVLVWRWIKDAAPIPLFAKYGDFKGHVDRWHYYDFRAPCIAVIDFGSIETGVLVDPDARGAGMRIFACHFITPVDATTCIDHWLHVRNFAVGDREVDERLHADFRVAFDEDKHILEAIEQQARKHPDVQRLRISIDAAPIRLRRKVETMIADEREGEERSLMRA